MSDSRPDSVPSDLDLNDSSSSTQQHQSSTIKVYGRLKPSKKLAHSQFNIDTVNKAVTFFVPKDLSAGYINNKKETYEFKFTGLFDQSAKQEEIFEIIAKPIVDSVLEGYNGQH